MLLELKNINKDYKLDKDNSFRALKNINLKFESSGLVCIKGASGSGKSTLLNLITLLDKPTNGEIIFNGENILKYKEKDINYYRNRCIGILFQNYNLIEDETVIYNIMLPALIAGQNKESAKKDALELLEKINFQKDLYEKKVYLLSGGEKQRVALLRSLINTPYILLCDEPTGALDSINSKMVMEILKKVAHRRLVILVSHNDELINEYADRIISIKDGVIADDQIINSENKGTPVQEQKIYKKYSIYQKFTRKNLIKRRKMNIFSLLSISISLTMMFLSIGFSYNANNSLNNASLKQFDLATSTISKENKSQISGSSLSISKVTRLNQNEIKEINDKNKDLIIVDNYSYFIPSGVPIFYNEILINNLSYSPIYSFENEFINKELLKEGRFPIKDSLKEVVINQSAANYLKEKLHFDPLNKTLLVNHNSETNYFSETGVKISDKVTYKQDITIVGIVGELSFLQTPKIYYSYLSIEDFLLNYPLNNLSTYVGYEYSAALRVHNANDNDELSSFSHYAFLKNADFTQIENIQNSLSSSITFTNQGFIKYTALNDFASAISLGLIIFLIIAIIGSIFIFGIINYSSYIEDLKDSAILTSLGCKKDEIVNIFINESLFIGLISFVTSIIFSLIFSSLINLIVGSFTDFTNLIYIPFLKYNNFPLALPLLTFLGIVLVSIFSTYIPISLSKKVSIKKELTSND